MPERMCEHPGCDHRHRAKGLCNRHYLRKTQGRDMNGAFQATSSGVRCTFCKRPPSAKGLCATHYARQRLSKPLDAPIRHQEVIKYGGAQCMIKGCKRIAVKRHQCGGHYNTWLRNHNSAHAATQSRAQLLQRSTNP